MAERYKSLYPLDSEKTAIHMQLCENKLHLTCYSFNSMNAVTYLGETEYVLCRGADTVLPMQVLNILIGYLKSLDRNAKKVARKVYLWMVPGQQWSDWFIYFFNNIWLDTWLTPCFSQWTLGELQDFWYFQQRARKFGLRTYTPLITKVQENRANTTENVSEPPTIITQEITEIITVDFDEMLKMDATQH